MISETLASDISVFLNVHLSNIKGVYHFTSDLKCGFLCSSCTPALMILKFLPLGMYVCDRNPKLSSPNPQ